LEVVRERGEHEQRLEVGRRDDLDPGIGRRRDDLIRDVDGVAGRQLWGVPAKRRIAPVGAGRLVGGVEV